MNQSASSRVGLVKASLPIGLMLPESQVELCEVAEMIYTRLRFLSTFYQKFEYDLNKYIQKG
jgi:hypothetical protein